MNLLLFVLISIKCRNFNIVYRVSISLKVFGLKYAEDFDLNPIIPVVSSNVPFHSFVMG